MGILLDIDPGTRGLNIRGKGDIFSEAMFFVGRIESLREQHGDGSRIPPAITAEIGRLTNAMTQNFAALTEIFEDNQRS